MVSDRRLVCASRSAASTAWAEQATLDLVGDRPVVGLEAEVAVQAGGAGRVLGVDLEHGVAEAGLGEAGERRGDHGRRDAAASRRLGGWQTLAIQRILAAGHGVVLRIGLVDAQPDDVAGGLVDGDDREVGPGAVAVDEVVPQLAARRRSSPSVGERGVADHAQLLVAVVRPRHQGDPARRRDTGGRVVAGDGAARRASGRRRSRSAGRGGAGRRASRRRCTRDDTGGDRASRAVEALAGPTGAQPRSARPTPRARCSGATSPYSSARSRRCQAGGFHT